jgi:peroxiredoxin
MITKLFGLIAITITLIVFSCNNQTQTGDTQKSETKKVQESNDKKNDNKKNLAKAPDFALKNSKGETVRLSSFKDNVIILNFWATWCGPCRGEIPGFVDLYNKYNNEGLEIIGVSLDQNGWDAVDPFVKNYKVNYPVLLYNRQVIMNYGGIRAIPTTFIINRNGEIVEKIIGQRPDSYFKQKVQELL